MQSEPDVDEMLIILSTQAELKKRKSLQSREAPFDDSHLRNVNI